MFLFLFVIRKLPVISDHWDKLKREQPCLLYQHCEVNYEDFDVSKHKFELT